MNLKQEIKEFSAALKEEIKTNKEPAYGAAILYLIITIMATTIGILENTLLSMTLPVLVITPLLFLTLIYFNYLEKKRLLAYIKKNKIK